MHWHYKSILNSDQSANRDQVISALFTNRDLTSPQLIDSFLHPVSPEHIDFQHFHFSSELISTIINRLRQARRRHQNIVIYGDYDADGICATAVLWEALVAGGFNALPFIPHREKHGYGLSIHGINDLLVQHQPGLIITVDNGIVAHEAVNYLTTQKIDIIITDHHQSTPILPSATAILHNTTISGSAVAWLLAREIISTFSPQKLPSFLKSSLDLLAIGTIADLMPLTGYNRSFVVHGLDQLTHSHRPGIKALKQAAGLDPHTPITTYHVGFVLAPRINAMGRLAHGLDALRLLCTRKIQAASELAQLLTQTNQTRQDLTYELFNLADQEYQRLYSTPKHKIIIISHTAFHEGVIGLIAGKLSEKYSKPSIIIAQTNQVCKASARSVEGINIIELIRTHQDLLINAGGHPGAAGFTIHADNLNAFTTAITSTANSTITPDLLQPSLTIECDLDLIIADLDLINQISLLEPFGINNPKPIFAGRGQIKNLLIIGRDRTHLKLKIKPLKSLDTIDAIGFGMANLAEQLKVGDTVDLAFQLDKNDWNNRQFPQLILKDIKQD